MVVVEAMKEFFESSSIHGLYHIASERKFARLFWIFVVLGGFIGAGYLIYESFACDQTIPLSTCGYQYLRYNISNRRIIIVIVYQ